MQKITSFIKGSNFILRSPQLGDEIAYAEYLNDYDITKWMSQMPDPYRLEDGLEFIHLCKSDSTRKAFAIEINGKLVGMIGLHDWNQEFSKAEIGYWLAKLYQGKGIAKESLDLVTQYGFSELGLTRIYAYVHSSNMKSAKLLEKSGFLYEGRLRKDVKRFGQTIDRLLYAKLKE